MSSILSEYDQTLSKAYRSSAQRAIAWADKHSEDSRFREDIPRPGSMMSAGINLYLLTGDNRWHDLFIEGWRRMMTLAEGTLSHYHPYPGISYALLPEEKANPEILIEIREFLMEMADNLIKGTEGNSAYLLRPVKGRVNFTLVEQLGSDYLIGAHLVSGEDRYLEALLKCSQFSMGANPLNLCYTTGMGQRFIEPFYLDYEYTDLPVPAGIPAYGPVSIGSPLPDHEVWGWFRQRAERYGVHLNPSDIHDWPMAELYFRYVGFAAMNEFTVFEGMREQIMRWAYLAWFYSD